MCCESLNCWGVSCLRFAGGIKYHHVAGRESFESGTFTVTVLCESAFDAFLDMVGADDVYPVTHRSWNRWRVMVVSRDGSLDFGGAD